MFDDIRPYYDSEINAAMKRIASDPLFPVLSRFVFPHRDVNEVREMVEAIDTTYVFQRKVMYFVNKRIIEESISSFTCTGAENLEKGKAYLFVSNHRDIMLDASLLQNVLVDNGLDSAEITFGANLMNPQLVVDIGRSNKMFKVERPGNSMREFYRCSTHLSNYIRNTLLEKGSSVWIAQRNGRTKDGVDKTDSGVIKMFAMSRTDDALASIDELNIVPVSVSYEWEPCDAAKAMELWRRSQGPYEKRPGEDLQSILSGILSPKGRVHFHICTPLATQELAAIFDKSVNVFHKRVAELIDNRIYGAYMLFPNNYIAHDILHGNSDYAGFYTADEEAAFRARIDALSRLDGFCEEMRRIFLGIYANPVDTKIGV